MVAVVAVVAVSLVQAVSVALRYCGTQLSPSAVQARVALVCVVLSTISSGAMQPMSQWPRKRISGIAVVVLLGVPAGALGVMGVPSWYQ